MRRYKVKKILLILSIIVIFLLTGCSKKAETTYTIIRDNRGYTIDTIKQTITNDNYTYRYRINENEINITYPDGSTFWWQQQGGSGFGGWSEDYDYRGEKYVSGDILFDLLLNKRNEEKNSGNPLLGIVFLVIGIWNTFFPYSSWYASYGWRYKNVEPSDTALVLTRCGGVIALIASIICFLI